MNRRQFVKTGALATAAVMAAPGYVLAEDSKFSPGDMYEFRHDDKTPLYVYLLESEFDDTLAYADLKKFLPHYTKGELRDAFFEEIDWKKKMTKDFIERYVKEENDHFRRLSGGRFQLDIRDVEHVNKGGIGNRYGEVTDPKYVKNNKAFRILVDPMVDVGFIKTKSDGKYRVGGGQYRFNNLPGLIYMNPFSIQISYGDEFTFCPTGMHEKGHGLINSADGNGYHSDSDESIFKPWSHFIGITPDESNFLGWADAKPVKTNPVRFLIIENELRVSIPGTDKKDIITLA
jgi:hypothetical protein